MEAVPEGQQLLPTFHVTYIILQHQTAILATVTPLLTGRDRDDQGRSPDHPALFGASRPGASLEGFGVSRFQVVQTRVQKLRNLET